MKALCYVEIDITYCANTYGSAPCTASVPTTGAQKCWNSPKTCQDRVNFVDDPATLRFAIDTGYNPKDIEAIPSLKSVSFSPGTISLGENLGQRATLTVVFRDHRHSDTGAGFDKYLADRDYNPFEQGTFWGKFRARHPYVRGRPLRLIRGELGQDLADMETRTYVIDSFNGPNTDGTYTLVAKDILKLADDDRAQAPALSNGSLLSGINAVVTTAHLTPAGIGDSEYAASGYLALGGKEIVSFTRASDTLTIGRGALGTTAVVHAAEDRVQTVLRFVGEDPATIIQTLLQDYAGVDPSWVPIADWLAETSEFYGHVLTANIAEPTGVNKLVSEIVQQAALAIWWDDKDEEIKLQVLRSITATADDFDESTIMKGSLSIKEQPDKRVSEVWTYYGQRNPLDRQDNADNYQSAVATVDLQAETDYGSSALKRIYSRWIPQFGRTIAERVNNLLLGRYKDPPRLFSFELFRGSRTISLGGGYELGSTFLQDETGAAALAPFQVTRLNFAADRYQVSGEEALFTHYDTVDITERVIYVDADTLDFNLRDVHDSLYPDLTAGDIAASPPVTLRCIVAAGVKVGASSTAVSAFDVGNWLADFDITIEVLGRIEGAGGRGGNGATGSNVGTVGLPGGVALYTRYPINLDDNAGEIWGGGGGGGARGILSGPAGAAVPGGGGAGQVPGAGGSNPNGFGPAPASGTTEAGGNGAGATPNNNGGGPGLPGQTPTGGTVNLAGGAAGRAIDGISYVTVIGGAGDRRGGEVN